MADVFAEYDQNTRPGPEFVGAGALPPDAPQSYPLKTIAYYLPQFHAIRENDEWWGNGFTEWTNVTKALPRYVGHKQPKLPADLGFYDLSEADALRRQAELIKRSGVYGLCIHDYWFDGRKLLETPLTLLLENPDIDIRFCLNWANENWTRRWDGMESDVLMQQRYDSADPAAYARSILPAVRDKRYIRIDGRPLIMVYRVDIIPDAAAIFDSWREMFLREGEQNPYLVMAQSFGSRDPRQYGMDAAAGFPPHNVPTFDFNERNRLSLLDRRFDGHARSYAFLRDQTLANQPTDYRLFPGVCPGWDNEARKPGRGLSFYNSGPAAFQEWLWDAATYAMKAPDAERIVFINAWNEWAEGAVLEPDRHYGFANLAAVRAVVDGIRSGQKPEPTSIPHASTRPSALNIARNVPARVAVKWRRRSRPAG